MRALIIMDEINPVVNLEDVIEFCCSCWGGIDHILIPSKKSSIAPEWLKFASNLDPDLCLINSKENIGDFKSQVYNKIGGISCYKWDDMYVNLFLENRDTPWGFIHLVSHLSSRYEGVNKKQNTLTDYDFLNAQGVYYNMAISRTGLLTNYLREFLDMSFTCESLSVSGDGLYDYMECLSHEKYTLSPLWLTSVGLKRIIPSHSIDNPLFSSVFTNSLTLVISSPQEFYEGFCLTWNLRRIEGLIKPIIFLSRESFSSKSKRSIIEENLFNHYRGIDSLDIIAPGFSKKKALSLKKAALKLKSIKSVDVYPQLNGDWMPQGIHLRQGEINSMLQAGGNDTLNLVIPGIKNVILSKNNKWSVDIEVAGYRKGDNGYILPKRYEIDSLLDKNMRVSSNGKFTVIAPSEDNLINLSKPSIVMMLNRLLGNKPYIVRETKLTAEINQIYQLFGGIENIGYIFRNNKWREVFRLEVEEAGKTKNLKANSIFTIIGNSKEANNMLEFLTTRNIFIREVKISCKKCTFANYYTLREIDESVICRGCGNTINAPNKLNNYYRLNNLVRESFKNRGSIPILLTIYFLNKLTKKSFEFSAGLDIIRRGTNQRFSDIDLVCVCDGRLIIVECKDLEDGIGNKDLKDIKEQILSLRKWGASINIDSVILSTLAHPIRKNGKRLMNWIFKNGGMPPLKILDRSELIGLDNSMNSITPTTNIEHLFTPNDYRTKREFV